MPGDGLCNDGAGACTLRAAIQESNALAGADIVELPAGTYALTIAGSGENAAATGDLDVSGPLTLRGAGVGSTTINATSLGDRVLHVLAGATLALSDISITGGNAPGNTPGTGGGGIRIDFATVTISGSSVSGNVGYQGGGIHSNTSTLTIDKSTVSNNSGGGDGNGVFVNFSGTTVITDSVISGNTGSRSSINNGVSSNLTITNSTISGNNGVVRNDRASLTVTSSTIAENVLGGIDNRPGSPQANVANSLIAEHSSYDVRGAFTSQGHNLIGRIIASDPATGFTNGVNGDQVGTETTPIDPLLGSLQDNGGPTLTHALLPDSPAIDAGNNSGVPSTDQRGFKRIVDGDGDGIAVVDIGAFEFVPEPSSPFTIITHGFRPFLQFPKWIYDMATAINTRLPVRCSSDDTNGDDIADSIQNTKIDLNMNQQLAGNMEVCEHFLLFDWVEQSHVPNVADDAAIAGVLATLVQDVLSERENLDIHFIGHSRGAFVIRAAIDKLIEDDILKIRSIQMTTLDPVSYGNDGVLDVRHVTFADNYYQQTGETLPGNPLDGQPVDGALNVDLTEVLSDWQARTSWTSGRNHAEIHDWYHWTIDTDDESNPTYTDGHIVTEQQQFVTDKDNDSTTTRDLVYPCDDEQPAGSTIAYHWSIVGGGSNLRPSSPFLCEVTPTGNIEVTVTKGKLHVTGDQATNRVRIAAGNSGFGSFLVTGLDGTTVNDQSGSIELTNAAKGIRIAMKKGHDRVFVDHSNGVINIGGDLVVETDDGRDNVFLDHVWVQGTTKIRTKSGGDRIAIIDSLIAGDLIVKAGNGNNVVALANSIVDGRTTMNTGRNSDRISIDDMVFVGRVDLSTGSGNDFIQIERSKNASNRITEFRDRFVLKAGAGDDTIEIGVAGESENSVRFESSVTLDGGMGEDTLDAGILADPNLNGNVFNTDPKLRGIESTLS